MAVWPDKGQKFGNYNTEMIEILIGADPCAAPLTVPTFLNLDDGTILIADDISGPKKSLLNFANLFYLPLSSLPSCS